MSMDAVFERRVDYNSLGGYRDLNEQHFCCTKCREVCSNYDPLSISSFQSEDATKKLEIYE